MDKYSAIMAAADFIERNPGQYDFMNRPFVPDDEGGNGCMWAWAGYYAGMRGRHSNDVAEHFLGKGRITAELYHMRAGTESLVDPSVGVETLRRFAQKFKPIEAAPPIAKLDPAFLSWRAKLLKPVAIAASLVLCLLASAAANAGTIDLPDPSVYVNILYANTTNITIGDSTNFKSYKGPSAFYTVGPCAKPNSPTYRCSIIQESNVLLTASDGSTAVINLTYQDAWLLNRSGHNMWVHQQIILAGDVTTP